MKRTVLFFSCLCLCFASFSCDDYLGGPSDGGKKKEPTAQREPGPEPSVGREPPPGREATGKEPPQGREAGSEPQPSDGGPKEAGKEPVQDAKAPEIPADLPPAQTRSCDVPLKVDARNIPRSLCDRDLPASISSVAVAGEFNSWKPDLQMKDDDGDRIWEVDVPQIATDTAYKIVINGQVWCRDPSNPLQKYVGGTVNSMLKGVECARPSLRLERLDAPAGAQSGSLNADIRFLDGTGKLGFDPASVQITVNGNPLTKGVQILPNGQILIRLTGLTPDRYTFRVTAADKAQTKTQGLYFYGWVEKERFQWSDATMYFVFVDRFANGDKSNDSSVGGVGQIANYQGGDLKGVLDQLKAGYFRKLGVNVLWFSPLYANPDSAQKGSDGRLYTGFHGYWPTEPRKLQKRYGDWDLLRQVSREAHKQGMRILVDLAANHVHKEHPYWKQHENSGWFHGFSSCAPNWDKPITCWFDPFLPDFDYRKYDAVKTMVDDAVYWAQAGELDGFRVDAVKHMRYIILYNTREALKREVTHGNSHFYMVGETFTGGWKSGGDIIKPFIGPQLLSGQFDFPIYWEILGTVGRREGGHDFNRMDRVVRESMDSGFYGPQAVMSNFIGNHDVPRFISHAAGQIAQMYTGDRNKAWNNPPGQPSQEAPYRRLRMAWTLLFALPGIPLIYYGDEIGLAGEGDPDNRRMMVWSGLNAHQQATRAHLEKLGTLRRTYPALRSAKRSTLLVDAERYAFLREAGSQRIIAAFRRQGSATLSIPVAGLAQDGAQVKDLLRNTTLTVKGGKIELQLDADEGTYLLLP